MKTFYSFLYFLVPTLRIRPEWQSLWVNKERSSFLIVARITLIALVIAYLGHFFFVDIPLQKEPIEKWAFHRFGISFLALISFLLTYSKNLKNSKYCKVPVMLLALFCAYMQGLTMTWRSEVPYMYSIVIPFLGIVILRYNVLMSVLILSLAYALASPAWFLRPDELPYIVSAALVGFAAMVVFRSKISVEVSAFISELENIRTQEKLISTQKEINDQVKAFLPREIYKRFINALQRRNTTTLQAIETVLRCRSSKVTCLYSDIRSFTQQTKLNEDFLYEAAIPNIRICTNVVELYEGIPKHIGDLIFAYFDSTEPEENIKKALFCGAELIIKNEEFNASLFEGENKIKRYVLISHGEAIVGNIGDQDASREITVLGNPANILSRIDPLTKISSIKREIKSSSLILTQSAMNIVKQVFPGIKFDTINLPQYNLSIKDFPEEKNIFIISVEEINEIKMSLFGSGNDYKEKII